ncbi:MAG: polysaccharide deacetylase family protein [Leptolyngbyaceae cyanobacterium T60_A2020_046]|nr:polysaccharide deacetylase family protein [Leptolyngbyaceae cyanobacterium T60_A2020_046]
MEGLAQRFPNAIFYKRTNGKAIALTIDDIPTPFGGDRNATRWILDAIARHNAHSSASPAQATWFVIGSHVGGDRALLPDILAQGHELGNHGWVDAWAFRESPDAFVDSVTRTHAVLQAAAPAATLQWYCPGRALYPPPMVTSLRSLPGYQPRLALASMLPLDTRFPTAAPGFTRRYALAHTFPGAILLLHGGSTAQAQNTARVLTDLLPRLCDRGYRILTLSDLWALPPECAGGQVWQKPVDRCSA